MCGFPGSAVRADRYYKGGLKHVGGKSAVRFRAMAVLLGFNPPLGWAA